MSFMPARLAPMAGLALLVLLTASACGSDPDPAAAPPSDPGAVTTPDDTSPADTPSPSVAPSTSADTAGSEATATTRPPEGVTVGPPDRPATLVVAGGTDPAPLLVLLHGYGSNPEEVDRYFGATAGAGPRGVHVLIPQGRIDQTGRPFWEASAACCNLTGTPVDDVGYLRDLIDETLAGYPVDPARVYVMGHSNGGFMSYRLACDLADRITAVAVVSGADTPTADECRPSRPVSVLHVHGDADILVSYTGGQFTAPFPGAVESVARWAARNGCAASPVAGTDIDLDRNLAGAETAVTVHPDCPAGIDVQLDTIRGGTHSPAFDPVQIGIHVLDWLLAHRR